jgi:hypothetical protein
MKRNMLLQRSDSFDESTGRVPQVNHHFVLGTSVLLPMTVCVKAKAPIDTDGILFVVFCEGQCLRPPAADNTTRAQDTDQRGLCKHWSRNSPQRVAGG